jgi:phosphatidylglycerol lysyltransferase
MKKISAFGLNVSRKNIIQVFLAFIPIFLCIYFIRHEGYELQQAIETIKDSSIYWILIGLVITLFCLFCFGKMYQYSFKSLNAKVPFSDSMILHLKRGFISVFLPAGGVTSLAFFSEKIEQRGISKTKIYFSSIIYSIAGFASLIVVAIPTIAILLLSHQLSNNVLFAFFFLILIFTFMVFGIRSFLKERWIFRIVSKFFPKVSYTLRELQEQKYSISGAFITIFYSILVELCGMFHLYIAMRAIGLPGNVELSMLGYVIATIMYAISPFMRGLGAVEISLSVVLISFGINPVQAISITLLYRVFEFWLPLFTGFISFFNRKDHLLLRLMPGIFTLLLGIINIISVLTPAISSRLKLITGLVPQNLIHFSYFAVIASGILLIFLSFYLIRGLRSAWIIVTILVFFSIIGNMIKGIDYEEAIFASFLFFILLYTRKNYIVKSGMAAFRYIWLYLSAGALFLFIYSVAGFYFAAHVHFKADFSVLDSAVASLQTMFFINPDYLSPHTRFAVDFILSIRVLSFGWLGAFVFFALSPYKFLGVTSEDELHSARELVKQIGHYSLDHFKTTPDKFIYWNEDHTGFISYCITREYAVVLEFPVCKDYFSSKELILSFEMYCAANGIKTLYYRVDEKDIPLFRELKKKAILIGQEGLIDIQSFTISGTEFKPIRNALNKVQNLQMVCNVYEPPLKKGLVQKLKAVSDEWLVEFDKKEAGFSQGIWNEKEITSHKVFVVEDREGKVYAFANIIPDYATGEVTYDLIRKTKDSPGGVLDAIMVKMIEYYRQKGKTYLNVGLAPMSGIEKGKNIPERAIKYAYENMHSFEHFKGLRFFKEKYAREWVNKYLVYNNDFDILQAPTILKRVSEVD